MRLNASFFMMISFFVIGCGNTKPTQSTKVLTEAQNQEQKQADDDERQMIKDNKKNKK